MAFSILNRLDEPASAKCIAVSCFDEKLTYSELALASRALSESIGSLSSPRTIGILAPSSLEYVVAMIAIWQAGGVAVPLQPTHPEQELDYIIEDAQIAQLCVHPRLVAQAEKLCGRRAIRVLTIERSLKPSGTRIQPSVAGPTDSALLIYTSGTTRKPKGVPTSFAGLDAQMRALIESWRWSSQDRTLNILPLHHVHGVVNVLGCALASGASCEMIAKFDPSLVWRRIAEEKITVFMAVPTVYSRLLETWRDEDASTQAVWSAKARALRLMVSGSAALPQSLFAAWEEATGHRLLERYGMTEIGMALSNPYEGPRIAGRVGLPLPRVDVRLVDEAGASVEFVNQPGEIQVRGPTVFRGYWRLPEISRESFTADGWFKTGDMGERDESGSYKILGRLSQDIIKSGGYKISALEIESALLENPDVAEVAVVGVMDPHWGERVAAAYVPARGRDISPDHASAYLKAKLAHYKVPSLWKRVESLPRNAMGKVLKPQIRNLFA